MIYQKAARYERAAFFRLGENTIFEFMSLSSVQLRMIDELYDR